MPTEASEDTGRARGWSLFQLSEALLLAAVDPLHDVALDEVLAEPAFEGGTEQWYCRMIGETPLGWELLLFERQYLCDVRRLVTKR